MGLVYKPEPPPPESASHEEKMAWYRRERARAVKAMGDQRSSLRRSIVAIIGCAVGLFLYIILN